MNKLKTYINCKIWIWINLIIYSLFSGIGASGAQFGIEADFIKNNSVLEANQVASNVFKLKNLTGKTVRFHLNFSVPASWTVLGQTQKDYELTDNDSIFVPIRVIPDKSIKGGTSYIITATIISDKNVQFAAQNWYVSMPTKTKWSARLPIKTQFFYNAHDSSGVLLHLQNDGNSDEEIRLTLLPDRRLEVLRKSDGGSSMLTFVVKVPAGTDTTIVFPVIRKPLVAANRGKDADLYKTPSKENYSMQILAKSINGNGSWSGSMQFIKAGNTSRQNDFSRSAIPLTVEANVYDVLSNGTTMSLDAYGNAELPRNRLLNYRFQTVFITNYFNENALLGNNNYIGYFDDKLSVELGEVNGWGRSLLSGRGIKASYLYKDNTVGAMMTRSPGFFKNHSSEGYGVYHNFKRNRFNLTNQYSHNTNKPLLLTNDIYNSMFSMRVNQFHQVSVGGGYSTESSGINHGDGYGYELNYSFSYNHLNASVGTSYGSPQYALARGITMYNTRTSYSKNQRVNYAFTTQRFTQDPSYFYYGTLIKGNYTRSDRYEFRVGLNSQSSSIALKPTYQWEEVQNYKVATRFLGVEYNAKNISRVRFSAIGTMGYAKVEGYPVPDFFVSRIGAYARWDKFYLSIRYTYGPVQMAEQIRYLHDGINPQTVYLVGSHDYWINENKLLLSTTGNLLYETYYKKVNIRLRPEVYYYAKNGLRFSFYASIFSSSQGANPLYEEQGRAPYEKISNTDANIGFGVRKQFGIPIPGKKFVTIHAVIFKDMNGNHKQDDNEEGVENMLVNIRLKSTYAETEDTSSVRNTTGEDFITNQKGEINYENIPPGIYTMKSVSLTPNGEWFDGGDNEFEVKSKQTIYIPLTRGVRINGSILVERDKYSGIESDVDLSRIRITAIDSTGKSYSALTERNGAFLLNLPSGKFTLTVNEAVLGDNFYFLQSKISLDLTQKFENFSITFNAVERKRKMDVKKFDGKEINKKQ